MIPWRCLVPPSTTSSERIQAPSLFADHTPSVATGFHWTNIASGNRVVLLLNMRMEISNLPSITSTLVHPEAAPYSVVASCSNPASKRNEQFPPVCCAYKLFKLGVQ